MTQSDYEYLTKEIEDIDERILNCIATIKEHQKMIEDYADDLRSYRAKLNIRCQDLLWDLFQATKEEENEKS